MDKILKIQSEIGALSKTETNPFFKSKYFDINSLIAQLQPLLEKHKVTVIQPLTNIDGKAALSTIVYSVDGADEKGGTKLVEFSIPLPDSIEQSVKDGILISNSNPQKMGSAITYYRRYALQSLFLLQAEDDDANLGSGKKSAPRALQSVTKDNDEPFKTDENGKLINEEVF